MSILKWYRDRRKKQLVKEDIEYLNGAYLRVFSTDEGKYILEHLAKTNLAVPIATKGADLLDIGINQGRANLVDEIIQRMEVAR